MIYLVRHGQTVFNTRLLIQGRCDSPLTDLGREQARAAAAWLHGRGVQFDAAFSSPAERACSTAEILWGGPYARLMGLSERSFGALEGTDVLALPKPMGDYPVAFGGESERDLTGRLNGAMRAIACGDLERDAATEHTSASAALPIPGRSDAPIEACAIEPLPTGAPRTGNVLVVSHGAACKTFARAWSEFAQDELPDPFPNCCVLVYRYDHGRFTLLEAVDPASHLGGEGLPI